MIKPTVGRVVWYWPNGYEAVQPCSAQIAFVHDDRRVNIAWLGHDGSPNQSQGVQLLQDDDTAPADDFCTWMPYQVGQAAKTEALEKQAKGES